MPSAMCRFTSLSSVSIATIIGSVSCTPIDSPRRPQHDAGQSTQANEKTPGDDAATAKATSKPDAGSGPTARSKDAGTKQRNADAPTGEAGPAANSGKPDAAGVAADSGSDEDAGPSC